MKRPWPWLRGLCLAVLLLILIQYVALTWLAPRYIMHALEQATGGRVLVERVQSSLWTTTLTGLRLAGNSERAGVSIQRVVLRPRWFSMAARTLWLESLECERPIVRVSRMPDGAFSRPSLADAGASAGPVRAWASPWRIRIKSLSLVDGTVEFVDEQSPRPFHGLVDHVSTSLGPIVVPLSGAGWSSAQRGEAGTSFAVRGTMTGVAGHTAPLYCSGWFDLGVRDLQASCRLEPIPLAAFEPYYHGTSEVRVYAITLASTSQWNAKANQFEGRLQCELANLGEGDLSVHGRTIINVKQLTRDGEGHLSAEIQFTGELDQPQAWRAEFKPGDAGVEALVARLREHRVRTIKLPLWNRMGVSLAPAGEIAITDVEAASREVQDALELLAEPPTPAEEMPSLASPIVPEVPQPTSPEAPQMNGEKWGERGDLNPRPPGPQPGALTD